MQTRQRLVVSWSSTRRRVRVRASGGESQGANRWRSRSWRPVLRPGHFDTIRRGKYPDAASDVRDAKGGYEVVHAQNGADALDTLKEGCRPRLILLDLSMPVMDGETFCERCREDSELASIPILVISADVAGAVKLARSRAAGMLAKPVRRESLLRAIARSSD